MKIQQQTPWKRLANFRKDPEHIEGFQVKLNAFVSMIILIYIKCLNYFINLIIQPDFQAFLKVEVGESSQKTSKSNWKYLM